MKLQLFCISFFITFGLTSNSQINFNDYEKFESGGIDIYDNYLSYQIYYDSSTQLNYFGDTISQNFKPINFHPRQDRYKKNYFRHGFLFCKRGDMKGLLDLDGNKILDLCHFIRFNKKDSLISAFVCSGAEWVYLNFQGDTLSHGYAIRNNYTPKTNQTLNKAQTYALNGKVVQRKMGIPSYGYLSEKAIWEISPHFHDAHDFEGDYAKVKMNGLWGIINQKGNWVITPSMESDDFEILKIVKEKGGN